MKQFLFFQVFFAAASHFVSSAAVKITTPYPANIAALSGTRHNTTCHAIGEGKPPDLVKFVIKRQFDYTDIPSSGRVYQTKVTKGNTTSVTLHFESLSVGDQSINRAKLYKCYAFSNASNKGSYQSWQVQVTVVSPSDLPKISYTNSMNATNGSTATINCSVVDPGKGSQFSFKEMKWMKNGKELKTASGTELRPLMWEGVTASNGGEYRCTLRIGLKRNSQFDYTITGEAIHVNVPVYLTKGDQEIQATVGSNVTFECSAEGHPLSVVWRKVLQSKEVEVANITGLSQRVSFRQECPICHYKMDIINVTEEVGGEYLCRTINSVGSVQQKFTLQVGESPPSTSTSTSNSTSSSTSSSTVPSTSSSVTTTARKTFLISMLLYSVL